MYCCGILINLFVGCADVAGATTNKHSSFGDNVLGKWSRADKHEPVDICVHELSRNVCVEVVCRNYVKYSKAGYIFGMIDGHAARNPAAAIMANKMESVEPQHIHYVQLILCHCAFGVVDVIFAAIGLAA